MLIWVRKHPIATGLLVLLVALIIAAWSIVSAWFVAGPWQALPRTDAPSYSQALDPDFEEAAEDAINALAEHRQAQGFPAITAAAR